MLPNLRKVPGQHGANTLRVHVIDRWNQPALLHQHHNVPPDFAAAVEITRQQSRHFRKLPDASDRVERLDVGQPYFGHVRSERRRRLHRGAKRQHDFRGDALHEKVLGHSDAHSTKICVGCRHIAARMFRDQTERQGDVAHRARQHTRMILRQAERHHALAAHPFVGRLQPDHAAERRRDANRSARVRTRRQRNESRRHRRSRSAARSAGNALRIPRIPNRAKVRIVRGDAIGKLVQPGFADHVGARVVQLAHDGRVIVRHEIREDFRPAGGADAASIDVVLVRDRNAVQRSAVDAAREFVVQYRRASSCRRFRDREERIQARIRVRHPPQRFFRQLANGKFSWRAAPRRFPESSRLRPRGLSTESVSGGSARSSTPERGFQLFQARDHVRQRDLRAQAARRPRPTLSS